MNESKVCRHCGSVIVEFKPGRWFHSHLAEPIVELQPHPGLKDIPPIGAVIVHPDDAIADHESRLTRLEAVINVNAVRTKGE